MTVNDSASKRNTHIWSQIRGLGDTSPKPGGTWVDLRDKLLAPPLVTTDRERVAGFIPATFVRADRRVDADVDFVYCAVLDLDDVPDDKVIALGSRMSARGYEFVVVSSYKHSIAQKSGKSRCRFVFPLAEPVPGDQWPEAWMMLHQMTGGIADEQCKNPSRFYFWPSCPPGAEDVHEALYFPGAKFLDLASLTVGDPRLLAAVSVLLPFWVDGERHQIAIHLAGALARVGWEMEETFSLIEAVCEASDDKEFGDRRKAVESTYDRYTSDGHVTGWGALGTVLGPKKLKQFKASLGDLLAPRGLPNIRLSDDERAINTEALEALGRSGTFFERGGTIVSAGIVHPLTGPKLRHLTAPTLREELTQVCRFVRIEGGVPVVTPPPDPLLRAVIDRGEYPELETLIGVSDFPMLRPDGSIITDAGFDPATGIYMYASRPSITMTSDIKAARELLLDVVCDFPIDELGKSAAISGLLSVLARPAIDGPCPLFLVDGNVAGAGKGLIVSAMSIIATGRDSPVLSHVTQEDEERKRITAMLERAPSMARIDNIRARLGSGAFDALLTSTVWEDRRLGATEMMTLPARTVWWATGNNIRIEGDTARRSIHCRMVSEEEHPDRRSGFKYPYLLKYCSKNRPALLGAALSILSGWFEAGEPDQGLMAMGSFEGWTWIVRNAMVWAGFEDPSSGREELRDSSDSLTEALSMLLSDAGLPVMIREKGDKVLTEYGRGIKASAIHNLLEMNPPTKHTAVREALDALVWGKMGANNIAKALHKVRDRVIDGRRLRHCSAHGKIRLWCVENVEEAHAEA